MVKYLKEPRCKRYDLSFKLSKHSLQTSARGLDLLCGHGLQIRAIVVRAVTGEIICLHNPRCKRFIFVN